MLANGVSDGLAPSQTPTSATWPLQPTSSQPFRTESLSPGSADLEKEVGAHFDKPAPPQSKLVDQSSSEFEAVPFAADDDFEWDERESLWALGDPGARTSSFDVDAELPKLTDGMATLTANDTNTGFLGSVSGASLLRLIASSNNGASAHMSGMKTEQSDRRLSDIQESDYISYGSSLRAQPLLTQQFVDTLVDAYFCHYHPTFPILHEPTFREQYRNLGNRPKGSWHVLANLVAALGSFVSSPCNDDTHITLFNAVKNSLSIESLEAGSLGLVQAFAMAANYLQKRNRPNSGYNYGGLALRLAISLGLHKEVHGWQTTPLKKELRRRVWWCLCVLDVGATVTYGRPLNWPRVGVDTPFPLNIHENQLVADSEILPAEVQEATSYTYINTQSSYHLRTMRIYDRLISTPVPTAEELITLDDDCIEGWRRSLPSFYSDEDLPMSIETLLGHSIGRWRYRVMRVVMYRPFLLRWAQVGFPSQATPANSGNPATRFSDSELQATKRCLKAAEECISVLFRFWTTATHTRLAAWYVLYVGPLSHPPHKPLQN
jgi:transcriptional regulatory protein GAL4